MRVRREARATSSPASFRIDTGTAISRRSFVASSSISVIASMVPRAFFRYSMERPATMKRASPGSA